MKTNFNFKRRAYLSSQQGMGLVEILIVAAVIGIALATAIETSHISLKISEQMKKNLIAANLAGEQIEAARALKEGNWDDFQNLDINTPLHLAIDGSSRWSPVAGAENIGNFSRWLIIENVSRDANDDIAAGGGSLDTDTRKVTAIVSWIWQNKDYQITLISYLTNWKP